MVTREQVEGVLEKIRPALRMDGGDVELVEVINDCAKIRFMGHCIGCPSSMMTLQYGIEETLRAEIPEFDHVILVLPFDESA